MNGPIIWFGKERAISTPGKYYEDKKISSRPIHCAGESGSGWKFEVITKSKDPNLIGEIITLVNPRGKSPYTSALFLPTLYSSGLKAGTRIDATRIEYIYYLEFILNTRHRVLNNWKDIRLSEESKYEIEQSISELLLAIENRKTQPVVQAYETLPSLSDNRGRANPSAANAKFTAMASRLELQIGREDESAGSMQKRRRFATKILASIEQNIWDMRNLHRLSPITVERELKRRISSSKIKPMLFAGLYCDREFGENLGDTKVLPIIIEVYTSEIQLMAIRNLIADIQKGENIKENLRILRVLLSVMPSEDLYKDIFYRIKNEVDAIEALLRNDNPDYKKICEKSKKAIRYRASDDPNHPWHIPIASSK